MAFLLRLDKPTPDEVRKLLDSGHVPLVVLFRVPPKIVRELRDAAAPKAAPWAGPKAGPKAGSKAGSKAGPKVRRPAAKK